MAAARMLGVSVGICVDTVAGDRNRNDLPTTGRLSGTQACKAAPDFQVLVRTECRACGNRHWIAAVAVKPLSRRRRHSEFTVLHPAATALSLRAVASVLGDLK